MEEIAGQLSDSEIEVMAMGEESEKARMMLGKRDIRKLDIFLNEVFDGSHTNVFYL